MSVAVSLVRGGVTGDDPQLDELLALWHALDASARADLISVARGLASRHTQS